MASVPEVFEIVAERLGRDLRTRFTDAVVQLRADGEEQVWVSVGGTTANWGEVSVHWIANDEIGTDFDIEVLVCEVTRQVADNMWPDEFTDPWPMCPSHPNHPLSPTLRAGRAVWHCLLDANTFVRIGSLASDSPT